MSLHFQPIHLSDTERQILFVDGGVVAVLVRLSDAHGDEAGRWSLEAGFGRVGDPNPPTFESLDEAQAWIKGQIG
ncbi:hypothetical protein ASG40_12960 [Methylobacterium sp. Leaf399]|uniref:hypothetical protein n=1 Tax=unclassified Methylobacterium TaxID=2615210 RepID=UPI0006FBD81B|nr:MULTISPECIES: hypothetical protein [unclassified Methylobacterium]KQP50830.1 hypothetical protein ASF39_11340 [Methylobacterium sp. Leaf108]KQT07811.1 hypothetical protein ASG40_12960 [Methylobacterium sp. Leaf399]KQT88926.1 hypothetical protein ASG59_13730 [Methylobacterium sp. Leaf466]